MSGPNYVRIRIPHPITGESIRMLLHVYVWLVAEGRWDKGETDTPEGFELHHIDFNPFNNALSNLKLVTHSEHKSIHWQVDRENKIKRFKARIDAMTPEQIAAAHAKQGESMKAYHASLSEEERKTRMAKVRVHHQVLSEDDVREIRRVYPTLKGARGKVGELQRRFGLKSPQHLRAVANGRLFPNVT